MNIFLVFIFLIHLFVASWLFFKKREVSYAVFIVVFIALLAMVILKGCSPKLMISGYLAIDLLRYLAVFLSVVAIFLKGWNLFIKKNK